MFGDPGGDANAFAAGAFAAPTQGDAAEPAAVIRKWRRLISFAPSSPGVPLPMAFAASIAYLHPVPVL
jgi:hypothetical protein